ncbi:hypothetical protein ON010_g3806 [Phytophthora cinnamomi]|nr:hypothetical protein ON010_g3806 [Phytophthora cinnamomi]
MQSPPFPPGADEGRTAQQGSTGHLRRALGGTRVAGAVPTSIAVRAFDALLPSAVDGHVSARLAVPLPLRQHAKVVSCTELLIRLADGSSCHTASRDTVVPIEHTCMEDVLPPIAGVHCRRRINDIDSMQKATTMTSEHIAYRTQPYKVTRMNQPRPRTSQGIVETTPLRPEVQERWNRSGTYATTASRIGLDLERPPTNHHQ